MCVCVCVCVCVCGVCTKDLECNMPGYNLPEIEVTDFFYENNKIYSGVPHYTPRYSSVAALPCSHTHSN